VCRCARPKRPSDGEIHTGADFPESRLPSGWDAKLISGTLGQPLGSFRKINGCKATTDVFATPIYLFFNFPRGITAVVTTARIGSPEMGLGGDVSFFGFLASLLVFC